MNLEFIARRLFEGESPKTVPINGRDCEKIVVNLKKLLETALPSNDVQFKKIEQAIDLLKK